MGHSIFEGFVKATAMILVSEIGDKTFFVAALMAMRHPRGVVLAGALGALGLMTVLSALFGWAAPNLISRRLTQNAATFLFFFFGLRLLWTGFTLEGGVSSELAEVEAELDGEGKKKDMKKSFEITQGVKDFKEKRRALSQYLSPLFLETFTLTFLGEWGDRSQIATIGLAAQHSVTGVALGGVLGHAICTSAAVLGGKHLATQISERAGLAWARWFTLVFGAVNTICLRMLAATLSMDLRAWNRGDNLYGKTGTASLLHREKICGCSWSMHFALDFSCIKKIHGGTTFVALEISCIHKRYMVALNFYMLQFMVVENF